jgi:hypothetical protein
VTIQSQPSQDDATKYQKPDHDLNTIGDLFAALRSCWSPPPAHVAREGMQMSVLFSFNKSGAMIAPPRMTFATPGAPADIRKVASFSAGHDVGEGATFVAYLFAVHKNAISSAEPTCGIEEGGYGREISGTKAAKLGRTLLVLICSAIIQEDVLRQIFSVRDR